MISKLVISTSFGSSTALKATTISSTTTTFSSTMHNMSIARSISALSRPIAQAAAPASRFARAMSSSAAAAAASALTMRPSQAIPRTARPSLTSNTRHPAPSPSHLIFGAVRAFSASTLARRDTSWVDKGEVTYAELKPETEAPSGKITIIDVREPDEVAQGIIPSAVSVPLSQFQTAFAGSQSGGSFAKDFGFERPAFDAPLVFYCRSGKRSQQALEYARSQGWWNTRNYTGSWLDWTANEEKK